MATKELYIRPIPLTTMVREKAGWTFRSGYGQKLNLGNYVWYIEGSDPKILVDSGASAEQWWALKKQADKIQSMEEGLAKIGLKPADIGIILITHLHFDHMALSPMFPNARNIVQKKELDFALNPHIMWAEAFDQEIIKKVKFEVIDGDKEIIKGVKVMLTPGLTPGSQSVAVKTPKGTAIICGFCSTMDNFLPPAEQIAQGIEIVPTTIHLNVCELYDSALKVKKQADILIPLHEISFLKKTRIPE